MSSVCVIGAGIIGLSTAYYCARRGHSVTVIDREPAQRDGCSFGNAGMIVPSHFVPLAAPGMVALGLKWMWNPESPFWIKPRVNLDLFRWGIHFWNAATPARVRASAPILRDLSLASRMAYQQLAAEPDADFGLCERGLLMLCRTQHALDEEETTVRRARELGLNARLLDARETAELDPGVRMSVAGAVYFPEDCHLSPGRFMDLLQRRLTQSGARFLWGQEVRKIEGSNGRITSVETDSTRLTADEVVVCGGAWSPKLAAGLGLNLPMQAGKGYSLTLTQPRQLPRLCAIFHEARVAVTPMGASLRIGGTMELGGVNDRINGRRVQGIIKAVPNYYPDFSPSDFEGIQPWYGLRPCSPDGLPYLGRTKKWSNLILATGHAMMGLSLGPITGQLVASLIESETPAIPLDLLSPDRFS